MIMMPYAWLWSSLQLKGHADFWHPTGPVGFQNSATGPDLGFYAARSYSLMRPPRTGRRGRSDFASLFRQYTSEDGPDSG